MQKKDNHDGQIHNLNDEIIFRRERQQSDKSENGQDWMKNIPSSKSNKRDRNMEENGKKNYAGHDRKKRSRSKCRSQSNERERKKYRKSSFQYK